MKFKLPVIPEELTDEGLVENKTYQVKQSSEIITIGSLSNARKELSSHLVAVLQAKEMGYCDVAETFAELRKLQNMIENYIKAFQPHAVDELFKLSPNEQKAKGLALCYSGEVLDYSQDSEVKGLEKALKERKELLKLASQGKVVLDPATGELIQKVGIKTPSKPYVKLTN